MESEEKTSEPGELISRGLCFTELPPEPSAKPGCADCLSIVVARENARSAGNYSGVSDCNVKLRQHHTGAHVPASPPMNSRPARAATVSHGRDR